MKAEKIKEIRIHKGLTLAKLAKKTGYTASYISKIERKLKIPSLEALKKIANCLDVPVVIFFVDEDYSYLPYKEDANNELNEYFLIKANKRKKFILSGGKNEIITPIMFNKNSPGLLGYCTYVPPKTMMPKIFSSHPEEESMIVIEGKIEIHLENKVILLEKGDSIYINRNVLHKFYNPLDKESIIMCYQNKILKE